MNIQCYIKWCPILILVMTVGCADSMPQVQPQQIEIASISQKINNFLGMIRQVNEQSASLAAHYYTQQLVPRYPSNIYFRDRGYVLADHNHQSNANLYVNASTERTPALEQFIRISEHLEERWAIVREKHSLIGWQYIVDAETGGERSYPWHNQAQLFGNNLDFYSFDFYYDLLPQQNPKKISQWVSPTNDLAGLGWICTISSPIYVGQKFVGVHVIDIPVRHVVDKYITPILTQPLQHFLLYDSLHKKVIAETDQKYAYMQNSTLHSLLKSASTIKNQIETGKFSIMGQSTSQVRSDLKLRVQGCRIPETGWIFVVMEPL